MCRGMVVPSLLRGVRFSRVSSGSDEVVTTHLVHLPLVCAMMRFPVDSSDSQRARQGENSTSKLCGAVHIAVFLNSSFHLRSQETADEFLSRALLGIVLDCARTHPGLGRRVSLPFFGAGFRPSRQVGGRYRVHHTLIMALSKRLSEKSLLTKSRVWGGKGKSDSGEECCKGKEQGTLKPAGL